jgi:flagellar FliL protein
MADKEKKEKSESSGGLSPKVILIGLPLYIIQLVAVYFVVVNFIVKPQNPQDGKEIVNQDNLEFQDSVVTGKYIYKTEDLIINPADGGMRLLLISLGLDVPKEEDVALLGEKAPLINDLIISILRKKKLKDLLKIGARDKIRKELKESFKTELSEIPITKIYFNKFIIQ